MCNMQNSKALFTLPLLAVIIVSGCVNYEQPSGSQANNEPQAPPASAGSGQPAANPANTEPPAPPADAGSATPPEPAAASGATIEFTDQGFSPKTVTIKVGEKVTWINKASEPTWPASAKHPTHTVYPGSSIAKCGTPEQAKIFDACNGIQPSSSWSFTFNEVGSWAFHDHLNPSFFGMVKVEG